MTKISIYQIDEYVTADDKWIGTDVNTYNKTKNFTPRKLSNYFNGSQVINTGVDLLYKYFTITPPETRPTGTLSFETEIGPTVNFSAISTFLLSNTTLKGNYIVEFFDFLVGTNVLLYKAKNINLFGSYKINSVEEYLEDPNFFVVNVEFIEGNGFIEEDEDYMISLIDISSGSQDLQEVTDIGSSTTNSITANSFIKIGGTGTNILLDNGNTVALSSIGGNTNLSTSQTSTNFTINSDTGDDATVPLGDGTLAGATLNDYTTTEKNKLSGIATGAEVNVNADWNATSGDAQILNKPTISGTNTGDQDLQSVINNGGTASNANVNLQSEGGNTLILSGGAGGTGTLLAYGTDENGTAIKAISYDGIAINAQGGLGLAMYATSIDENLTTDKNVDVANFVNNTLKDVDFLYDCSSINVNTLDADGIRVYTNSGIGTTINQGSSGKGLVINSGTSSTGVPLTINKNGVDKLVVNQAGELTATKLIKDGGTSSQILAADGSVITQGNNITITGGVISSVGGSGGGGSSVNYYLNGGTSQGTFGGSTYYEFSKTAVIGTGADFSRGTNGYIASFITDVADPSLLLIPAGNWNLEFFFNSSSAGGSPSFYVELYKYDGTTFTLITSNSTNPEGITGGTAIDAYFTPLAVPETILTVNDRLAIRVFVNASSKTITLHTQNGHLCEVITTFTSGLTALNGLQAQVQNFAPGTTGTDFDIVSSGSTHTFNLPSASATARGVVTTGGQTFAGTKTFSSNIVIPGTGTPLILGTSSGGTVNGLSTTTYPDLTELSYVKGVTSSLQTQFSGKQATLISGNNIKSINGDTLLGSGNLIVTASAATQSAYTLLANNTASTAVPTEQVFENLTNQTYSGTIVWGPGTAPSTNPQHTYSLSQVGNLVTLIINLSYGVAGAGTLTSVACELPSTAPLPALPTSVSAALDIINYGTGVITTSKNLPTTNLPYCALRIKSVGTPNVYEVVVTRGAAAYRYAYVTIQYFV